LSSGTMTLGQVLERVRQDNLELKASRKAWEAAQERPAQASALDDPMLTVSDMLVPLETRGGPLKGQLAFFQKFPFWGDRALRGRAASMDAEIARQSYRAKSLEILSRTVRAYYELYFLERTADILKEQTSVLERFARVAEKKYAVGREPQAMVFRAQVELAGLATDLVTAQEEIVSAQARLNALLERPPRRPLGAPESPAVLRTAWDAEALSRAALADRPELLALRALKGRRTAEKKLALRKYFPDLTLGYQYSEVGGGETMTSFDGRDAVGVSLGLNIPLWLGKNRAAVRQARASLDASKMSVEDLANRTRFQVVDLLVKVQTAARLYKLYDDTVLPQARSALDSTQSAYEAGSAGFLDFLDAERALLRFALEQERHRVDYAEAVAQLERVVGGPLPQEQGEQP
ncbi:MAG: TolC family protein, partial [Elusimicrobia bacterium]|nr:TolC family protein [Elusimicrobiota bacterium]